LFIMKFLLTNVNNRLYYPMSRPKHPNKEIEAALCYAEQNGWVWVKAGGSSHPFGRIKCPYGSRGGCLISVWSTPKRPTRHAKDIRKAVDKCPHLDIPDE